MRSSYFFDSSWYCYANSTAMLLNSFGFEINPQLIEILSGVGLGAFNRDGFYFFSGLIGEPDTGITKALEILGFTFEEKVVENPEKPPFDELQTILKSSPVVIGPLDMMHLVYNPDRPQYPGVDHYVLVYSIDGNKVFVNDPAGFAHVFIDKENLTNAWRADAIAYKRGYYRFWAAPKRERVPTEDEVYSNALQFFKTLYIESERLAQKTSRKIDKESINELATIVRDEKLNDRQIGFLTGFALPLGAKRAYHYSQFFKERYGHLAQLKGKQSLLFGQAHALTMYKDWKELYKILVDLSGLETEVKKAILAV